MKRDPDGMRDIEKHPKQKETKKKNKNAMHTTHNMCARITHLLADSGVAIRSSFLSFSVCFESTIHCLIVSEYCIYTIHETQRECLHWNACPSLCIRIHSERVREIRTIIITVMPFVVRALN